MTTSMPAPDYGCDFGTGLRRNNRFLDGAAQLAQACVRNAARVAQAIARKHRMSAWFGHATVCRGFALVGLGHQGEGIAHIQTGLAAWHVTGARLLDTQWLGFTAEARLRADQLDDALDALDRAAETAAATGEVTAAWTSAAWPSASWPGLHRKRRPVTGVKGTAIWSLG